jgi:hypothetical protein
MYDHCPQLAHQLSESGHESCGEHMARWDAPRRFLGRRPYAPSRLARFKSTRLAEAGDCFILRKTATGISLRLCWRLAWRYC